MAAIRHRAVREVQKCLLQRQMSKRIWYNNPTKRRKTRHSAQKQNLGQCKVHSDFDDRLSGNLSPSYSEQSMAIDDVSRSCVPNCRQPACFHGLRADERYKHVTALLCVFLNPNLSSLVKAISVTSTGYCVRLPHRCCSELEWPVDSYGRCLRQGAASPRLNASALMF